MAATSAAPVPVIMFAADRIVSLETRRPEAARPRAAMATPATTAETAGVVRNRLEKAIRHTPYGGTVRIVATLDAVDQAAAASVADGCRGNPSSDLPNVLETAYRDDIARASLDDGSGPGSAVRRGWAEGRPSEIDIANEGDGSLFAIRLPFARNRA